MLKRVFPQVVAWTALLALSAVVALAQDGAAAPASGQRSDGQIEMDVVHALDASAALKNDLITAATIQGEVTLAGTVASEASKELAESIAAHVSGVASVHNNLKIGNPQQAQAEQPAPVTDSGDVTPPQAQAEQPAPVTDSGDVTPPQAQAGNQQDSGPAPPPQAYPQEQQAQPPQEQGQAQPYPPGQGQAPYPAQGQAPYPGQGQQGQAPYPGQQQEPYSGQGQAQAPYPPPYPQARPQYAPQGRAYAPAPAYETPQGPVTIPQGTLLQLRTSEAVNGKRAKDGEPVQFSVIGDVAVGGVLAIPRGATVHGVITEDKKAGQLTGSPVLALTLTSLDLGGQSYPLNTDQFKVKGPSKTGQTVGSAVSGGLIGTIIGCAVGRGAGCAIGAGAGVAAGTAASAASPGPGVWIPAEARVDFHLNEALTVEPVSAQEAARLAQGLYQGGPTLYRRGPYPYGSPYYARYYGSPYYAYPPVYYRPYYMVGGFYTWR
jgi:hypothetical protein